jgi:DNA polymerase-3 subunit epsilon
MSWSDRFVAFDTETTGVGETAQIVEIAVVLFDCGNIVDLYEQRCNPVGVDWDDPRVIEALGVNHLRREDLEACPPFSDVFEDICGKLNAAPVWVAHNADFDLRMLRQERMRLADPYAARLRVPLPVAVLDTLLLDFALVHGFLKRRLDVVGPRWKVDNTAPHRARGDAMVCGEVLRRMAEQLPDDIQAVWDIQADAREQWAVICERARRRDGVKV